MSHVTRMNAPMETQKNNAPYILRSQTRWNESCHTYEMCHTTQEKQQEPRHHVFRVRGHFEMSHVTRVKCVMPHVWNESRHTGKATRAKAPYISRSQTVWNESCHMCEMSHISRMKRVTAHRKSNKSHGTMYLTFADSLKKVMSHVWNASCHTCEMRHATCMKRVTPHRKTTKSQGTIYLAFADSLKCVMSHLWHASCHMCDMSHVSCVKRVMAHRKTNKSQGTIYLAFAANILNVKVHKIANFPDKAGFMDRTDPFVKLVLGHESQQTSVKVSHGSYLKGSCRTYEWHMVLSCAGP